MLIWGKKQKEKSAGFVADFCPICRTFRKFELKKVSLATHIYYVAIGDGEFLGYEATCENCSFVFGTDISNYRTSGNAIDELQELIPITFPNIEDVYKERIEIEDAVKKSPLTLPAELRAALIKEPFLLLSQHTELIYRGDTKLDWRGMLGCLSVPVLPLLILLIGVITNANEDLIGWLAISLAGIGLVYSIWLIATSSKKRFRKEVLPKLMSSLGPLQPSAQELSTALELLEPMKLKIVHKIKVKDLVEKLQETSIYQFSSEQIH